ncbi:MAG: hypothetical protein DWQ04_07975 [Chloroflexi bacterium]|nr:MAG: hypothetical protein DWQ04_07975 [Chloroflexota bacterium]
MELGYLSDVWKGGIIPGTWIEGEPEKSFWTGTKVKGKRRLAISAFRCTECGYLELYANR